jgi:hypothetical protein
MEAFNYSNGVLTRKHGPKGYARYESYREWLRDEFTFRCAYCLTREQWWKKIRQFEIDHFRPQSIDSEGILDYDNLIYSCAACNAAKQDADLPDPAMLALDECLRVESTGEFSPLNQDGKRIIEVLRLNNADNLSQRQRLIRIFDLAKQHDPELFAELMGFPRDLPNLSSLRPPINNRPEGVERSYYRLRERGELPDSY